MSRRKRIWRGLVLGLTALTLLVLLAAVGVRVYGGFRLREAERRFVAEVGPLDPAAYAPTPVPEERNAANVLLGGAQAIVLAEIPRRKGGSDLLSKASQTLPPDGWSAEELAGLRAILTRNTAALALLRQARTFPDVNLNIPYRDGFSARVPNLLQARDASRLLSADAAVALMDGDLPRAVQDIEALGVQARAFTREPSTIVLLMGMAIERQRLRVAALMTSSAGVDGADLERVRASLRSDRMPAMYRRAMALEGVQLHRAFLRPESLPGVSPPSSFDRLGLNILAPLAAADSLDWARAIHAAFSGTKAEIAGAMARLRGKRSLLFGDWPLAIPNLTNGAYRAAGTESVRRLAAAGLDLRLEALRTGRYPDSLPAEHLQPEPLVGVPLRYARHTDGSASVEVPGAAEIWKEVSPGVATYRWTLPPPPAPR